MFDEQYRQYAYSLIYDGVADPFLGHAETLARTIFFISSQLFGDRLTSYLVLELGLILLVHTTFFLVLRAVTKSTPIALVAAAIFVTDFVGSSENFAYFAYFIWKIPQFIFVFLALLAFLKNFYWQGIALFGLSLFLSHFSLLFSPFFIIYLALFYLGKLKIIPYLIKVISLCLPFIVLGLLVIQTSVYNPGNFTQTGFRQARSNPVSFFIYEKDLAEKVLLQATAITIPQSIIKYAHQKFFPGEQVVAVRPFIPIVLIGFITLAWIGYKSKKYKILSITALLSFIASLFINLYLDRMDVYSELYTSRYYFIPGIFLSILLGISLFEIYSKLTLKASRYIAVLLFVIFIADRVSLIQNFLSERQFAHSGANALVSWVRANKDLLPVGSIIAIPNQPLTTSGVYFMEKFYGQNVDFIEYDETSMPTKPKSLEAKLIVLRFTDNYKNQQPSGVDVFAEEVN